MRFWYVYAENWEQPRSQFCPHWDTTDCRYGNVERHTSDDKVGIMMTLGFQWTDTGSATYALWEVPESTPYKQWPMNAFS